MLKQIFTSKKVIISYAVAIAVILIITIWVDGAIKNKLPKERVIIQCYQTNIRGQEATLFAQYLQTNYPAVKYFEVNTFLEEGVLVPGYAGGWQQITTLLANDRGDIILLDKAHYDALQVNKFLLPIKGDFGDRAIKQQDSFGEGQILAVRVNGLAVAGLNDMDIDYPKVIESYYKGNEVYAVICKNASDPVLSNMILNELFSVKENET